MKELFCSFEKFFHRKAQKSQGKQQYPGKKRQNRGKFCGDPASRPAQDQQVPQSPQQEAQEHEQPQPAPAGDAAQEEEQHRGQQGIGQVQQHPQLFQPGPAQTRRVKIVEEAQRAAAGQAQQGLQPLCAGIDAHQPSSLPRKPRLRAFSPAYSMASILPSTSSSPPSRVRRLIFSPLP